CLAPAPCQRTGRRTRRRRPDSPVRGARCAFRPIAASAGRESGHHRSTGRRISADCRKAGRWFDWNYDHRMEIRMSEYVLLYRSTPEAHEAAMGTPEARERSMAKWRAWAADMTAKGQLRNLGLPLQRTGKVVRGRTKDVTDGPYVESKEVVGGFSIIEAQDAAEAARIASGCPMLEGGGSVEVRPVLKLDL